MDSYMISVQCTLGIFLYLILREDFLSVVPKFLRIGVAPASEIRVQLAENQPQKQVQKDSESTYYWKGGFRGIRRNV